MPQFRMDPSLSWGDVGMAAGLLISGVVAFATLQGDVKLVQEKVIQADARSQQVDRDLTQHIADERAEREAMRRELRGDLKDINAKLDKLIEREISRPAR